MHDLLGIPFASASLSPLMLPSPTGPHPGQPFAPGRSPLGRARDVLFRKVVERTFDRQIGQWHNGMLAEVGLPRTARHGFHLLLSGQLVVAQGAPSSS